MEIEIRDHREPGWFWLDTAVISEYSKQIRGSGILTYAVLAMHSDNKTQECWPSLDKLADETTLSRQTVVTSLKRLEEAGLILKMSGGGRGYPNRYRLLKVKQSKNHTVNKQSNSSSKGSNSLRKRVQNKHGNYTHGTNLNRTKGLTSLDGETAPSKGRQKVEEMMKAHGLR